MARPIFGNREWDAARKAVAACEDLHELTNGIMLKARQIRQSIFEAQPSRLTDREFWQLLGVNVVEKDITHSGGHFETDGVRIVFVQASEHPWRKRFTVAHEVGHFLLEEFRSKRGTLLPPEKLERVCDEFASHLLIPRLELSEALEGRKSLTPELLNVLCRRFRVNLQPMLIAIAGSGYIKNHTAFLAKSRGHPSRPKEVDYRIEKCPIQGDVFLPKSQRLRSLGLGEIGDWAATQPSGQISTGRLSTAKLPLWKRGFGTGVAVGPVVWRAQTLARLELLILLETSELEFQWHKTSPSRSPK